jgi:hypothetical protein
MSWHDLAVALFWASAILTGIAVFLYNDGHDHKRAGGVAGAVGFLSTMVFGALPHDPVGYDKGRPCTWDDNLHPVCPKIKVHGVGHVLLDGFVLPGLKDMLVAVLAGLAGLLLAKMTSRKPADGRGAKIFIDD